MDTATKPQDGELTSNGYWFNPMGEYTRHPVPVLPKGFYGTRFFHDFTADQHRWNLCHHEAAHFVLFHYVGRMTPLSVSVVDVMDPENYPASGEAISWGVNEMPSEYRMRGDHFAMAVAAGERAEDRWMREEGLWTPKRAWASEVSAAHGDRSQVADSIRQLGAELDFSLNCTGNPWFNWWKILEFTDRALNDRWHQVRKLAYVLHERGTLTGEEAVQALLI